MKTLTPSRARHGGQNGPMRKIDAFAHILPPGYLQHLERHLASTMRPDRLRYYQEGVFRFDPVISDLDARFRVMDRHGDYAQILVLAVPPLEEVDPPQTAAELARRANEELADLVRRFPDRFAGFVPPCRWVTSGRRSARSTSRSANSARSASSYSPTSAACHWTTPASTRSSRASRSSNG